MSTGTREPGAGTRASRRGAPELSKVPMRGNATRASTPSDGAHTHPSRSPASLNFRAFPGPAPQRIEFGGKNLLVYGENGAGKSSIFHALRAVFSDAPQRKRGSLADYKNQFSTPRVGCARVDVAFDGMTLVLPVALSAG